MTTSASTPSANTDLQATLRTVVPRFCLQGGFADAAPYGSGHINDTYLVRTRHSGGIRPYIIQRINHHIFQNVPALMDNITRTTRHLRSKASDETRGDIHRRTLTVVPTRGGDPYLFDGDAYWRCYLFIGGARTYDVIEKPEHAREAARAFGAFQRDLEDLPGPRLHETIPDFHHTRARFDALRRAVEEDPLGRAAAAGPEIGFAMERESMVDVLLDLQAAGELPERITHNDTKLNNVMLDDRTSEGICVIDLDTVMPGLALYDFGDMVRTATSTSNEDERDLSRIQSDPGMFRALVEGYLSSTRGMLTPKEIELLPFSGRLITFETGLRFLTDHLTGDHYFKTRHDGHNLDRCRTQFQLVRSLERLDGNYTRIVEAWA